MAENDIRITRVLPATAEEVYDAWTDETSMRQWMLPGPIERADVRLDPRVGGTFNIDMHRPGGGAYPHVGEYLRLERPSVLEFTWISPGTNQQRSVVTVELTSRGEQTELTLTHRMLPSAESAESHRGGWTNIVDKLAAVLSPAA